MLDLRLGLGLVLRIGLGLELYFSYGELWVNAYIFFYKKLELGLRS